MSSSFLLGNTIRKANSEALKLMLGADPVLVDVVTASEAIPELEEGMILHSGPPIDWDRMCGPMRGAVAGIAVFEGWANVFQKQNILLNPEHSNSDQTMISVQSDL